MTGVGIIEVNGDRVTPVYYDAIKAGTGEFTERLGIIFSELQQLIKEYRPDQAAIETVFVAHNAASAERIARFRSEVYINEKILGGPGVTMFEPL